MSNGRTESHIFQRGSVISLKYVEDVLEFQVRLSKSAVAPEFLPMDDRPHRAYVMSEFFQTEKITRLSFAILLNDLNSTEHAYGMP